MDSARSERRLRPLRTAPAASAEPAASAVRAPSPPLPPPPRPSEQVSLKVLVAGGFGVGKTTLVGSVSEIRPLRTEERLSAAGEPLDDTSGVERKGTTTVAMDFGRIDIRPGLSLYLFGTPGQERFWFAWDELAVGALGAVVLTDTRRLTDCFAAVDYFEQRGIPFVVAVNCFDGARIYPHRQVREALDLDPEVPVLLCDARSRESVKQVLVAVVEHAMSTGRG